MHPQALFVWIVIQKAYQAVAQLCIAKHLSRCHRPTVTRAGDQRPPLAGWLRFLPAGACGRLRLVAPACGKTYSADQQQGQHKVDDDDRAGETGHEGRHRQDPQRQDKDAAQGRAQSHRDGQGHEFAHAGIAPQPAIDVGQLKHNQLNQRQWDEHRPIEHEYLDEPDVVKANGERKNIAQDQTDYVQWEQDAVAYVNAQSIEQERQVAPYRAALEIGQVYAQLGRHDLPDVGRFGIGRVAQPFRFIAKGDLRRTGDPRPGRQHLPLFGRIMGNVAGIFRA